MPSSHTRPPPPSQQPHHHHRHAGLHAAVRPALGGLGLATLALAAVVGLSRVYLGVHFPLDIAGGLLLAPLAAALVMPVWRRVGTP